MNGQRRSGLKPSPLQPSSEAVHVPGSSAATVQVQGLLNSLPRLVLKTHGTLRGFLLSMLKFPRRAMNASPTVSSSAVWPMPIPYPEAFVRGFHTLTAAGAWDLKRAISMQVVCFSWLALGSPSAAPRCLAIGTKLSAQQWSFVRYLERLAVDGNSPNEVDAALMARSAAKVEGMEAALSALCRAAAFLKEDGKNYLDSVLTKPSSFDPDYAARVGKKIGEVSLNDFVTAKALEPSRLVFPGPPKFNPSRFLDARTQELYERPLEHCQSPDSFEGVVPPVRVFATHENKVELYKKLADSGRLEAVPARFVRRGYLSGLFGVPKDLERDRMVLDGRPPNCLDPSQTLWCQSMANPIALCSLALDDHQILLASGEDLRDFFYQFKATPQRTIRNVLSDPVSLDEARYIFGPSFDSDEDEVWVALSSLAMGDKLACEYAQGSHVGVCLVHGVACIKELITLQDPLPRGLLQVGIIIDDLVLLEKCLLADFPAIQAGERSTVADVRLASAAEGYADVGLETNPKKAFRNQHLARFWGIEVDGLKGLLRGSSTRLWPTIFISLRVAALGLATAGLLQSLAGSWVSLLSCRRRMFCLLDNIFGALCYVEQNSVLRLSKAIIDELVCLAILAPAAAYDLRAPFHKALVATDASLKCMAGVQAPISVHLCRELCRTALTKGRWTNLLSPALAWERQHDLLEEDAELPEPYHVHPFWELCARSLEYKENWRHLVVKPRHINILEAKAYLTQERRIAVQTGPVRVPFALDSQVCLGSLIKGRSSSPALNAQLRSTLGYAVAGGVFGHYLYFPSACNRADGPTRDADPAAPDMVLPAWMNANSESDFLSGLDSWLDEVGASFECGLPFDSLTDTDERAFSPASQSRPMSPAKRRQEKRMERSLVTPKCSLADAPGPTKASISNSDTVNEGSNAQFAPSAETACPGNPSPDVWQSSCEPTVFERLASRFPRHQFFFAKGVDKVDRPGALDLYSGNFGVAKQMVANGCPWVLTFEIKRSLSEDLLDKELQDTLLEFIGMGVFLTVGMAPICASFSRAITPAVRSRRWPRGIPGIKGVMRVKILHGNNHAMFCLLCIIKCEEVGAIFWCENPDKSFLWLQKGWERFARADSSWVFRLAYCRFGTAWQKMTRVATNGPLASLRMPCKCNRPHQRLRGYCHLHKCSWTSLAERYPRGVARMLALNLCVSVGWCSPRRLSIAGCAKASSYRIGEATNPGPRPSQIPRPSLHELHTLTTQTLALESRILQGFVNWCKHEIRDCRCDEIFDLCPEAFVYLLKVYGDLMFQEHRGLSNFRHLLLAAQRWKPLCRPFMSSAWELISRWEQQEPVEHRVPIPEPLVRALIVLSWLHGWYGWSCATAIAFYGGGRLGEILRCCRQDLLLPADFLEPGPSPVFLRLSQFKSKNRQPAKVQHLRVVDVTACRILHMVFRKARADVALFGGSPYQYRKRWDALLASLQIPPGIRLTPGGLRGGFAVWAYRSGRGIQDIMWSLRLRSQSTLESYLQETAALNCFVSLPNAARDDINALSSFFTSLPAAV